MFDQIKKFAKSVLKGKPTFDPSTLNDPVAMTTEWIPLKRGGSSFKTHVLTPVSMYRLEYRLSTGYKVFSGLFTTIGLVALFFIWQNISQTPDWIEVLLSLSPLIFVFSGIAMYYFGSKPTIFDKEQGYFWKGRKSPKDVLDISRLKKATHLDDVHAIQVFKERVQSDKSSYTSYEINLVLKNGDRLNVIDHGHLPTILQDTQILSEFLDAHVWKNF